MPSTSTWAESGSTPVTASSRSGVSVSDARVTIREPIARRIAEALADRGDGAEQDAAGVGLGVVHLAALGDDRGDPLAHRDRVGAGALADVPERGRVEAEPLDRELELARAHRRGRVEPLRGLRQRARRRDDPAGPEVLPDVIRRLRSQMNDR